MALPLLALDLTVIGQFETDEDVQLPFSYADLRAKFTASPEPDRFSVVEVVSSGTVFIGPTLSGPWTLCEVGTSINPGTYLRYVPEQDVNGLKGMMSLRAHREATQSAIRTVDINIASVPDPIVASNGTFVQPASPKVTEDTPYTFSFAQLATTLAVYDGDGEPYKLVITSLVSGTLTTTGGAPITLPYDLNSGESLRWQAAQDAFTFDDEPPIAAFRVRAANTAAPLDESAEVVFSTPVVGVADTWVGGTTLGSIDPIIVTRSTANDFTYRQLRALCRDTNDVDRTGQLLLYFNGPAIAGTIIQVFNADNNLFQDLLAGSAFQQAIVRVGYTVRIIVPNTVAAGVHSAGEGSLSAIGASLGGQSVPVHFDVRVPGGSTPPTGGASGGGGGCGAGAAGLVILLMSSLRRRRQRT